MSKNFPMQKARRDVISETVFLFLFFCVIGWLYEVSLAILYGYGFINRGFLFGPYLPLYGFGALLLIACLRKLIQKPIRIGKLLITPVLVFLAIVLITTVLEYAVGFALEMIFHQRFWDYSSYRYQLHGRISLSASIRFGVCGMVFLYLLAPLFTKLIGKIPPKLRFDLSMLILLLLAADLICTLTIASVRGFNPMLGQAR